MIRTIKKYLQISALMLLMAVPMISSMPAYAACSGTSKDINTGVNAALGSGVDCSPDKNDTTATDRIKSLAARIVSLFSLIIGIVAIIMIIVGGFKYITSGGDSNKVGGAKSTIIYAVVGLIIVALAQVIVKFVLNETTDAVPSAGTIIMVNML